MERPKTFRAVVVAGAIGLAAARCLLAGAPAAASLTFTARDLPLLVAVVPAALGALAVVLHAVGVGPAKAGVAGVAVVRGARAGVDLAAVAPVAVLVEPEVVLAAALVDVEQGDGAAVGVLAAEVLGTLAAVHHRAGGVGHLAASGPAAVLVEVALITDAAATHALVRVDAATDRAVAQRSKVRWRAGGVALPTVQVTIPAADPRGPLADDLNAPVLIIAAGGVAAGDPGAGGGLDDARSRAACRRHGQRCTRPARPATGGVILAARPPRMLGVGPIRANLSTSPRGGGGSQFHARPRRGEMEAPCHLATCTILTTWRCVPVSRSGYRSGTSGLPDQHTRGTTSLPGIVSSGR